MRRLSQLSVVLGLAALVLLTLATEATTSHAALPASRTGVAAEMAAATSQPAIQAATPLVSRSAAEPAPAPAATPATAPAAIQANGCLAPGAVQTVLLSRPARINKILVEARGAARGASARVLVVGGQHARVLRAGAAGTHVLTFEPSLQAASFDVTVAPGDEQAGAATACITRVELLAGTTEIAAFGR